MEHQHIWQKIEIDEIPDYARNDPDIEIDEAPDADGVIGAIFAPQGPGDNDTWVVIHEADICSCGAVILAQAGWDYSVIIPKPE